MNLSGKLETASPQRRARSLLRGRSGGTAIFAPMIFALAARVEGWEVADFVTDPTRMARGIDALHKATGSEVVYCSAPAAMEAEAGGVRLDWTVYPPRVAETPWLGRCPEEGIVAEICQGRRVAASLEVVRRLGATIHGEPLLAATVTGPWTLASQLGGEGWQADPVNAHLLLERSAQVGRHLVNLYCEAGADLVVIHDDWRPAPDSDWQAWLGSAMMPLLNTIRFHKRLLAFTWPGGAEGSCFAAAAIDRDPAAWSAFLPHADIILTAGEVPPDTDLTVLPQQVAGIKERLAVPAGS